MRLFMYIVFCSGFLIPAPSLVQADAGWTDHVQIEEVVPTGRHYYEVKLSLKTNRSGCRIGSWFYQDYGLNGSEKMYDTLLQGLLNRSRIRLYVTGKCNVNGYAEFTAVGIVPQ